MKKDELARLLNRINSEYIGKLDSMTANEGFFDAWYESLKEYDTELIYLLYRQYDDSHFPPTAKYFSIGADKELASLKDFYRECANEIWYFAFEECAEIREILGEYMKDVPYTEKRNVAAKIVKTFRNENEVSGRVWFRSWLHEH